MDYRIIFVLLVKTVGLFLIVDTVAFVPDKAIAYFSQPEQSAALLLGMVVLPISLPLVLGAFLLLFPATASRAIVGPAFTPEVEVAKLIQPALFSGVGIYFAVIGFQTLVYYEAYRRHAYTAYDTDAFQSSEMFAGFLGGVFLTVAGVALLFGSRGLSGLVQRLRG